MLNSPAAVEWGPAARYSFHSAIAFTGFEIPTTVDDRVGVCGSATRRRNGPHDVVRRAGVDCHQHRRYFGESRYDAGDLVIVDRADVRRYSGNLWFLAATVAAGDHRPARAGLGRRARASARPRHRRAVSVAITAVVCGLALLVLAMSFGWGDAAARLWVVPGILLLVVYVAATQANSRLDDSTAAWAVFALMAVVLMVVVFLTGVSEGWWPTGIAAAIVAVAAGWALNSGRRRDA